MRRYGWSWSELQATPENILGYLALIDDWDRRRDEADAKLAGETR